MPFESRYPKLHASIEWLKGKRIILSRVATMLVFTVLGYWIWQNRTTFLQTLATLNPDTLLLLLLLLVVVVILSAFNFAILVRGMGYAFSFVDGYHSLNLSQIAAIVPGRIWGFAGLAGLLWARGISKRDSLLIIPLYTLFMLSSAILAGIVSLLPVIGWGYIFLALSPVFLIILAHHKLEDLRERFYQGSSPLPSRERLLLVLFTGFISWAIISASFAWLVYSVEGCWRASPWLIAGAYPAGYVGGYLSLITPVGLGVREGIITLILQQSTGGERAMALALIFRVLHTIVLWANTLFTMITLSLKKTPKSH